MLVFVVGNLPGFGGAAGAIQAAFFRAGFTGLWLAAAGVAIVYFLIPRISARPPFVATRLSLLGFWSLAFVWPLTAPAALTYGPVPDWLETVGVVFSIALAVPVLVILTDLALAVRHRWQVASGDVTLRFVVLGAVLFALFPLVNLMLALHSSSAVIGFTDWVTAVRRGALVRRLHALAGRRRPPGDAGGVRPGGVVVVGQAPLRPHRLRAGGVGLRPADRRRGRRLDLGGQRQRARDPRRR